MGTGERALKTKQAFYGSPTLSSWQMRCRTAQVREQSRRNADFLEFEFPGSPGPCPFTEYSCKERRSSQISCEWEETTVFCRLLEAGSLFLSGFLFWSGCGRRAQGSMWFLGSSVAQKCPGGWLKCRFQAHPRACDCWQQNLEVCFLLFTFFKPQNIRVRFLQTKCSPS